MRLLKKTVHFSWRKMIVGIILAIVSAILLWQVDASPRFLAVACLAFIVCGALRLSLPRGLLIAAYAAWFVAAMAAGVYLSQLMLDGPVFELGLQRLMAGMLCCGVVYFTFLVIAGDIRIAVALGLVLLLFLSTVDIYVVQYRGFSLSPFDILSVGTAINVAGSYRFELPKMLVYAWTMAALLILAGFSLDLPRGKRLRVRLAALAGLIMAAAGYGAGVRNLVCNNWLNYGTVSNGFLLNFSLQCQALFVTTPPDYSPGAVEVVSTVYAGETPEEAASVMPTIIAIMNESYADLSIYGSGLDGNGELLPFTSSFRENAVSGYALASVYGGSTANSEFEFLTGNSMAWLPGGSVPYQQYLQPGAYSLVTALKRLGYTCVAMHPYFSTGWRRPYVYSSFGFDEKLFLDDFPQADMIRDHVSDAEMYDKIISLYESRGDAPLFLFGVTMQNHGGYEHADFTPTVHLDGYVGSYPDAEEYLTLIRESDKAIESLIGYFSSVDDPVVVVFFGDHQPSLNSDFYAELHGGSLETLEERMLQYTVPFFVWANYEIESRYVALTSLNYLSNYMLEVADIPLPPYNRFLKALSEQIPAMNAHGYYTSDGALHTYDEEDDLLNQYAILQYNSVFDAEHRNATFFPSLAE